MATNRSMFAALRAREFALLWSGQTVSLFGDGIFTVALALETLHLSKGPHALSLVLAARILPNVLTLVASGVITDRIPRRLAIFTSDAVRAAMVTLIAVLVFLHALHIGELIGISALFGIADAFFYPAYIAIIPELLSPPLLANASALNSGGQMFGQTLIGPAIGGLIVAAAGTGVAFSVDAATFIISTICVFVIKSVPTAAKTAHSILKDAKEGFRFVRSQPWCWYTILAAGVANFASLAPMQVLLPLLVREVHHASDGAYGFVVGSSGVGGIIAAIVVMRFGSPKRRITIMWAGWSLGSLTTIAVALAPSIGLVALATAVAFGLIMYSVMLWNPMMQELVPPELLGRAASIDWLFSFCLAPLGIIVAGVLSATIGVKTTMISGALLASVMGLVIYVPGVRDPERLARSESVIGESKAPVQG